jgi:hypothetical protein
MLHRGIGGQPAGAPGFGQVAGEDCSGTAGEHAGCPGETSDSREQAPAP